MENSDISWTKNTFNPWEGCTKVSPGCQHCYAENRNIRFAGGKNWGKGAPRRRTSADCWKQPLRWDREAAAAGERPRVFCASLADWLDDEVPIEWFVDLLWLVYRTQNLDWLMLTKRPQNWAARLELAIECQYQMTQGIPQAMQQLAWFRQWMIDWSNVNKGPAHPLVQPPANVWIGTTVEDQTRADERIPLLLSIPAKVRFLSCEPLLESVLLKPEWIELELQSFGNGAHFFPRVDWVICGGESGPGARPMHPDWARSLRDQCAAAGDVAFHFKQWGGPDNKTRGRLLDSELHDAVPTLRNEH